jgi:glycosyltransferase involved in cell wall biosynthesis
VTEPTVAALVPHFRCEGWLDHCLSSLLAQSRPPDAVIVIDDASPEPPAAIVRRFPGVTLLRAPVNVGPYRLIQQVIDDTAYDWYLLQDADDWSAPERLERLLAAAGRTGAELVGSDYLMFCTDELATLLHPFPLDANAALAAAPTCHAVQHPTALVRRDLVVRLGGFASGMRFSGDDEFLRRAAHAATVVNVPRVLYFRRHRSGSLTTSSATGHGSASRRRVLEALAARARANAAAVARGEAPVLAPFATAAPIALDHLCGPDPHARSLSRGSLPERLTRQRSPGARAREPVFVVGAPAAGADALLWALGQHPATVVAADLRWLVPLLESVRRAATASDLPHVSVSATRRLRPLDALGKRADDLRAAAAEAVHRLLLGAPAPSRAGGTSLEDELVAVAGAVPPGVSHWVGLLPADAETVTAAAALFPSARLLHVVRHADDAVAALARRSKVNARPLDHDAAYRTWTEGVRAGLQAEGRFGPGRVLRVRFDELATRPAETVRACLAFAGLRWHDACARPFAGLEVVESPPVPGSADSARQMARELSAALCGPTSRVDDPLADGGDGDGEVRVAAEAPALAPTTAGRSGPPPHVAGPAALLATALPPGAVVAVVTKGEPRLVDLEGVTAWHFPQGSGGEWAGFHPASTDDVVHHLRQVQARGATHFLIPYWATWWLDYYRGLREAVLRGGRLVADSPDGGVLFELGPLGDPEPARERVGRARRRRVTVVAWNTTHNPLGRAHVLAELLRHRYDVELVGARFEHFGKGVWAPLRELDLPLRTFPGESFPGHLARMEAFARTIGSDAVVVNKPRLPAVALGLLAQERLGCPLLLDVDDWELSFVGAEDPVAVDDIRARPGGDEALANPWGLLWTQCCEGLVGSGVGSLWVSNETLRARYGGGVLVPHARDEELFDPARVDRGAARERLGFGDGERVVLFGGTPRRHKGVVELAAALAEVGDGRVRLCLIATTELAELAADLAPYEWLVRRVPYQRFADMPALLAAADAVAVLQDPASPVSRYQMPAKVTDALAMQVPCVVNRVPPLAPLLEAGHLEPVTGSLAATLAAVLGDLDRARDRAAAGRELFLRELSFGAVRPRVETAVESLIDEPPPPSPAGRDLLGELRRRFSPAAALAAAPAAAPAAALAAAPAAAPAVGLPAPRRQVDVVVFWKQNDTGIYGRRHDMLMAELARSPRVRKVISFDAPIDAAFPGLDPDGGGGLPTHARLVREATLRRLRGHDVLPNLHQHSFVYADGPDAGLFPRRDEFVVHVKDVLARHGVGDLPTVFWVYPRHLEFPDVVRALTPDLVVADVVDDHRTWAGAEERRRQVLRHYEEIGRLSDLVLANCEQMRETMAALSPNVHLVPNGAEYPDLAGGAAQVPVPEEVAGLPRPLLGYVGNLSSRIDVDLLDHLARQRPGWQVVLVGSAHAGRDTLRLRAHANVHFVGPRPYQEAKRFVRAFDVGLIPHLDGPMTRAMHPLKAFVYCALGLPTVSTDIANLGELRPLIAVARDRDDFVDKVEAALGAGRRAVDPAADAILRRNAWSARAARILDLIDGLLAARTSPVAAR